MYIIIVFFILFYGVLSSHPGTYMKFSLITIYYSNVPRSRSHVNASMVLTRATNLFIHLRSLLNNILRPIYKMN